VSPKSITYYVLPIVLEAADVLSSSGSLVRQLARLNNIEKAMVLT
jgi:hypothetical protein